MIQVEGVELAAGAYRVVLSDGERVIRGLVPEHLLGCTEAARPSHQTAHEALASKARPITEALLARADDRSPRAPWDAIELVGR